MDGYQLLLIGLIMVLMIPIEYFFYKVTETSDVDDPAYEKNDPELIERSRRFEDSKE